MGTMTPEEFLAEPASPMKVSPEEQARRDRLAADIKADELNNPENPLHPRDAKTREALTRDLARTEAKAAPKPAIQTMSADEFAGPSPEEEAKGFVENFKKHSKATQGGLSGAWHLFADENMFTNIYRYVKNRPELERALMVERARETQARQILKNQDQYSIERIAEAQEIVRAADAKKAREAASAGIPGAAEGVKNFVSELFSNPGKVSGELLDSIVKDPWQLLPFLGPEFKGVSAAVGAKLGQRAGTIAGHVAGGSVVGGATNAAIASAEEAAKRGEVAPSTPISAGVSGAVIGAPMAAVPGVFGKTPEARANAARGAARAARDAAYGDTIMDSAERYAGARPPAEPPQTIPPRDLSKMSKKERAAYDKARAAAEERFAEQTDNAANYDEAAMQAAEQSRLEGFFDEARDAIPPAEAEPAIGHLAGTEPKGRLGETPIIGEGEPPMPHGDQSLESALDKVRSGQTFDLSAEERIALRGHVSKVVNEAGHPAIQGGKLVDRFGRQAGKTDPALVAAIAGGALAALWGGEQLDDDAKKYLGLAIASTGLVGKGKPFYHAVPEALKLTPRKAGTAAEWAKEIDAAHGKFGKGAKEEWEAMGGPEWLAGKGGKVTRPEIENFIREHSVGVNEVVRKHPPELDARVAELKAKLAAEGYGFAEGYEHPGGWMAIDRRTGEHVDPFNLEGDAAIIGEELDAILNRNADMGAMVDAGDYPEAPKFDSPAYKTPGGTNYRETVYTVPQRRASTIQERHGRFEVIGPDGESKGTYYSRGDAERALRYEDVRGGAAYQSSHWPEPNVFAHTRTQDFTTPRGERVHHIDEVQSDWAQQMRDHERWKELRTEYEAAEAALEIAYKDLKDPTHYMPPVDKARMKLEKFEAAHSGNNFREAPPPGPFVHSTEAWTSFVVRREIARAIAEGKDYVTWAPGREHSKRYGGHAPEGMEGFYGNEAGQARSTVDSKVLGDYMLEHNVGAQTALDTLLKPPKPAILTSIVEKILKKMGGGKVESILIDNPDYNPMRTGVDPSQTDAHLVPGFRITPAMREKAAAGSPLFARQGGSIDPKLLAGLGLGLGGAALVAWLAGKDKREYGMALGAVLGTIAALKGGQLAKGAQYVFGLTSHELKKIDPALRRTMVAFERSSMEGSLKDKLRATPFIDTFRKLSSGDAQELALALYSGSKEKVDAALATLKRPGLREALDAVNELYAERKEFLTLYKRLRGGGPEYYFHRSVSDVNGLLEAVGKMGDTELAQRLAKAETKMMNEAGRELTPEERSAVAAGWLRELEGGLSYRAGYTKQRGIEVTPELLQYYHDPATSLMNFLAESRRDIERTKLFGAKAVSKKADGVRYLDVEGSISNIVQDQAKKGNLTNEQADRLKSILRSRLGPGERSPRGELSDVNNLTSLALLAHGTNAITQLTDLANAAVLIGIRPMVRSLADSLVKLPQQLASRWMEGKVEAPKYRITLHDLGLVNHTFDEIANGRWSQSALDWGLKWSGFSAIDTGSRHVIINGILNKYARDAKAGGKLLEKKYGREFSAEERGAMRVAFERGENIPAIRDLVLMELSDIQPATRLERPQGYLDNPNGRFMYHLKSFLGKQVDIARRQVWDEMRAGRIVSATKNAAGLALVWGAAGAAVGTINAWLLNKEAPKFSDAVAENIMKSLGWSDFLTQKAVGAPGKRGDVKGVMSDLVLPPAVGVAGDILTGNPRAVQYIPLVGRLIYNRVMGGGIASQEREQLKQPGGAKDVEKQRLKREEAGDATTLDKERMRLKVQKADDRADKLEEEGRTREAAKARANAEKLRGRLERMALSDDKTDARGTIGSALPFGHLSVIQSGLADPWVPPNLERGSPVRSPRIVPLSRDERIRRVRELRKVM